MVTEMVEVPGFNAVTFPFGSTVATLLLLDFNFGMLREVDVQVNCFVSPQDKESVVLLNVIMGDLTRTLQVTFVSSQHTVIVVMPGFLA